MTTLVPMIESNVKIGYQIGIVCLFILAHVAIPLIDKRANTQDNNRAGMLKRLSVGAVHIIANILLLLAWPTATTVGKILFVLSIAVCALYVIFLASIRNTTASPTTENYLDNTQDEVVELNAALMPQPGIRRRYRQSIKF